MNDFLSALKLIVTFDPQVYEIIGLTLVVTIVSALVSSACGVPLGILLGSSEFRGRKIIMKLVNTFMGIPPVVAGLIVFLLLSRSGPLGSLSLLFTPTAMVIAQVLLIWPIVTGLTASAISLKKTVVLETCKGLCLSSKTAKGLLRRECKTPIISACIAGYGRAISEVGAIMLVGGNILHKTRVLTTAIVLETGKGNFAVSLALGLVLLLLSFAVTSLISYFGEGVRVRK